ncbi:uncharacterized protein UV8b_01098 [Ustilaginoidea virens]|uniref:MFS transporter n=1 Tax=Ustilaginoidea virens TaxID=1159556 RepID=A0A8E5HKA7_USTVR|nr:uncharacterized protein UV8b_01098 [Ustilaginoidea virens]QUC16857.1 hypothetical protein UV8b_01098 [Ustilaginoidea virens]
MPLYILHVPAVALCGGLVMFGVTSDRGLHWIWPSVGGGLLGFGLGSITDACLTWVMDSYVDITGEAFTGIVLIRNTFSIGITFAVTPWMQTSGLTSMFITCSLLSLAVSLTMLPMVYYGKRFRRATARRYRAIAASPKSI